MTTIKKRLTGYLFACLALLPAITFADTLLVKISGIKAGQGNLRVGVFDEAHRGEFPEGKYLHGAEVPATEEEMTVEIPDLDPGKYAIAVIQDLNDNQKLDRNKLKIPKEPYGFSGKWKRGSASFHQALINTEEDGSTVTIKLK